MSYIPIVLEDKDFNYIVELIIKDLDGAKACRRAVNTLKGYDFSEVQQIAEENIEQAEELLEQLRYFYRHFKIKGRD